MDKTRKTTIEQLNFVLANHEKHWRQVNKEQMISASFVQFRNQFQEYQRMCMSYIYPDIANQLGGRNGVTPGYIQQQAEIELFNKYGFLGDLYMFALNKKKEIYYIRNIDFAFDRNNYQSVFNKWGYYYPSIEFFDGLYQALSLRKEEGPYWKYIYYKQTNNCSNCIFDVPQYFSYFEENIFFTDGQTKYLLNEKTYKMPISINNQIIRDAQALQRELISISILRQPNLKQFKAIMDLIKPFIKSENSLSILKNCEQMLLQFIINHLQKNHDIVKSIQVNQTYIEKLSQQVRIIRNGVPHAKHILEERQAFFVENKKKLPIKFIRYLSTLDSGDLEVLDQFAMTIARINLLKNNNTGTKNEVLEGITPKITIIITPNVKVIKKLFEEIYPNGRRVASDIAELCNKKKLSENILFKLNGGILQIAEHSGRVTEENLKMLKKFIRSIPVSKRDNAVGSIKYISNCHYVLLADKQEDVNAYKNYFQDLAEIIVFKGEKIEELTVLDEEVNLQYQDQGFAENLKSMSFPSLDELDYKWIHTIFATHGLLLLTDERNGNAKRNKSLLDIQKVVKEFIKECCIISDSEDCYADELYVLYKHYFIERYGIEPVKRIRLVNLLRLDGRYIYCRLRHNAKDNRWGFKGLAIKKEKLEEYIKSYDKEQLMAEMLIKHIEKINEKIIPLIGIKKIEYYPEA